MCRVCTQRTPIPEPHVNVRQRSASSGSSFESHKFGYNVDLNSKHHDFLILKTMNKKKGRKTEKNKNSPSFYFLYFNFSNLVQPVKGKAIRERRLCG